MHIQQEKQPDGSIRFVVHGTYTYKPTITGPVVDRDGKFPPISWDDYKNGKRIILIGGNRGEPSKPVYSGPAKPMYSGPRP